MSTHTRIIDIQRIHAKGAIGVTVVQMMMAAGDIATGNVAMRPFMEDQTKNARHLRYLFRLQCGHLREALKLIKSIEGDPDLRAMVQKCLPDARAAFDDLLACATHQVDPKGFIDKIRNKVVAHYDDCLVERAIELRAAIPSLAMSSVTFGEDVADSEYRVASDIEETLMVRCICEIPDSLAPNEAEAKIGELLGYANGLAFKYVRFCAEFAHRCLDDFGAVK